MFSVVAMVIVMAMVMVVNKEATFQGDYQCCGDDDGDDVDVFKEVAAMVIVMAMVMLMLMMVVNKEGAFKGGLC